MVLENENENLIEKDESIHLDLTKNINNDENEKWSIS
jgi:hypothetical protein